MLSLASLPMRIQIQMREGEMYIRVGKCTVFSIRTTPLPHSARGQTEPERAHVRCLTSNQPEGGEARGDESRPLPVWHPELVSS